MIMYLLLIVGFILLIKGADFFVDGASSLAGILKVPSVVIGLTIVSLGTSAPEAAVSITAGLSGSNDISLGNVIGSNIFNLLMVVGVCALCFGVKSPKDILKRDMWVNIAASVLLILIIFDKKISRIEGVILLALMVVYLVVVVRSAIKNRLEEPPAKIMSIPRSLIYIVIGIVAIIIGGDLVVDNASLIAESWGMSETLVGLTIVAFGTSLPELVTSLTAAKKGDSGIALGNAIGSCIFNILFILGIASVITPIVATSVLIIDSIILLAVSVMMALFSVTKGYTSRIEGAMCVGLYIAYAAYIIIRDTQLM